MRIRTQLFCAVAASIVAGLLGAVLVLASAQRERAADEAQARAQATAHEVSGLLALTQDYARHAQPRASQQWRTRHATLTKILAATDAIAPEPALVELRAIVQSLPPLFARLEELPVDTDDFTQRRREALLDQLLTSAQAMSDDAYLWFQDAAAARAQAQREFQRVALATPLAMLALLLATALVVRRRVVRPVRAIEQATAALSRGNLGFRIGSDARDELGDLSRAFDAMTAELRASGELRQRSERQLRDVADNLPALVAQVDASGQLRFANAPFRAAYGSALTLADALGASALLDEHVAAARRGERRRFERQAAELGADVHQQVDFVPDAEAGYYLMIADVSERKRAELQVARSEQRVLDLVNNIPAMVAYFDLEERCQYANDAGLRSQGRERSELPGLTLRAALGEANYALHEPFVREALLGRRTRFEGKIPFQGRVAHYQAHLIPDLDAANRPRGFYLMTFDITALREAQLRQQDVERRLRGIADNLPVLIAYIDERLRWQFVNRTYESWLGIDPAVLVGRPMDEHLPAELYRARRPYLERALAGERVTFDAVWPRAGETLQVQTTYIPDIRPDGSVAGLYALTHDVTAMKEVERQLSEQARRDTLTGLPNRLHFNEALPTALARAQRAGNGMALMFLDVDRFKSINDSLGHAAGDAVLREFANRLLRCVRVTDCVARLAGDEFIVILEGLHNAAEAALVARKVVDAMRPPFEFEAHAIGATTSIGVAYAEPGAARIVPAQLLERADEALYATKAAGRNGYRVLSMQPQAAAA